MVSQKNGQSWGVGGEFDNLKKPLSVFQNVVRDVEKQSLQSYSIKLGLNDLHAAFYDVEDLLEEWNIEVMRRESLSKYGKSNQVITSLSPLDQLSLRLEISDRAMAMRERIEAIAAKGRDFGLRECAEDVHVERGSRNRERSDSYVYNDEIIGREDAKKAIMKFLLDSDTHEQISVLSICGKSGMGKSALARCLYKDDMVNKHFDVRIWVCVGDYICTLEKVLRKIIKSATTERADGIGSEQLPNLLIEHIRGKRYLLVIDHVMSSFRTKWGSLKSLLMGGAEGSKILITTCLQSVAHSMGTTPSYFLEALSEKSSLDLLMRMACEEEEETRDSIKLTIGRRIVEKCGGIPLAIRTIGSILFFMKTAVEWLHFEHEIPEVSADFVGISSHLKLSYEHLVGILVPNP